MTGIEILKAAIIEDFAEKCDDFDDCLNCIAWAAFEELVQRCPDLSEEDTDMALHWWDRYAAGIDAYPQFDRVAEASTLQSTLTEADAIMGGLAE